MSWLFRCCVAWCLGGCTNQFDPALLDSKGSNVGSPECRNVEEGGDCVEGKGTCRAGNCCQGCWDGVTCQTEKDSSDACGVNGRQCTTCKDQLPACDAGECVAERAVHSIAASAVNTCVADREYTVWCWGSNSTGASGGPDNEVAVVEQPVVVATGQYVEVAAGGEEKAHACGIHFKGSLWCWGDNSQGQLGIGDPTLKFARGPQQSDEGPWLTLAAGDGVSCGIRTDSTLWCWGSADRGRNALGEATDQPKRVGAAAGYTKLSLRKAHGCALLDSDLYCWGDDSDGQLGLDTRPVAGFESRPSLVSGSSGWRDVAVGTRHTCAARLDGSVWCWGNGAEGQNGSVGSTLVPAKLDALSSVVALAAGDAHTCAIDAQGALYCWGSNEHGQLGVTGLTGSEAPVAVAVENRFRLLAVGYRHTCAVTTTGVLYCWGASDSSQLGLGSTTDGFTPRAVALTPLR